MIKDNQVVPLRQSKLLINKHLECYCFVFERLLSDLSLYFQLYLELLHWFIQGNLFPLTGYVCLSVLLVSSLFCKLVLRFLIYTILTFDQKKKKHPVLPLRQSKLLINKHQDCYSLTSPQIINYFWSYRTPIQARLVSLEN